MAKIYFFVLCLVLLISGCGKTDEEKAVEKKIKESTGADAKVDVSKKGMRISGETEGGKYTVTTGEATEIPKNFPADVFIYRPSKAITAMEMPEGHSLSLTTGDDVSKVVEIYKQEMPDKGWSEETSMKMGAQSVLMFKKEERLANITISVMDGETRITVTVTKLD